MKSKKDESSLSRSVLFTFTESGHPNAIFLNASTHKDEEILKKALDRLVKPSRLSWLKELFR